MYPTHCRRTAAVLTLVLSLVLVATSLPAAGQVAMAATPSTDVFTIDGWNPEGGDHLYRASDSEMGVSVGSGESVRVGFQTPGVTRFPSTRGSFTFTPRPGDPLQPGRAAVVQTAGEDGVQVFAAVNGAQSCSTAGHVEVLEVTRDALGLLTGLALDYDLRCLPDVSVPSRTGSLRWNSDLGYRHTIASWSSVPAVGPGLTRYGDVTVTNAGTLPQTYGASTLERVDSWRDVVGRVSDDGCTGRTLEPGQSCTVTLALTSDGVSSLVGRLRTPDQTSGGYADVPVFIGAVPAPVATSLAARPVRGGVALSTSARNPTHTVLRTPLSVPGTEKVVAEGAVMPWTDRTAVLGVRYGYRVVPWSGGVEGVLSNRADSGALPSALGAEGTFTSVDPVRVLDTRNGTGVRTGAVGPGETLSFTPTAGGALSTAGVSAVLLNVTGTEATRPTHVRVWPASRTRPLTSSLNLVPGRSRPNQVVVPVGADGRVSLYNDSGQVHLVVDLQGFYSTATGPHGGGYHPVPARRALDSRTRAAALAPGEVVWVPLDPDGSWRAASAVDVNITVTGPTASGHLTAWDGNGPAPTASNANFVRGQTVANHAVVPVGVDASGRPGIAIRNSAGSTHVLVDVQGWYDSGSGSGLRFSPSTTTRVLDTRVPSAPVPHRGAFLQVPAATMPAGLVHVVNVTSTQAAGAGHLLLYGVSGNLATSTLNYARGEDAANLATSPSGTEGELWVYLSTSATHVVVDHLGFYY